MDEAISDALRDMIARHGRDYLDELRACTAAVQENLGPARQREANVLNVMLRERIPQRLLAMPAASLTKTMIVNLAARVAEQNALKEDLAQWAIETWADSFGLKIVGVDFLEPGSEQPPADFDGKKARAAGALARASAPAHWRRSVVIAGVAASIIVAALGGRLMFGTGSPVAPAPAVVPAPAVAPAPASFTGQWRSTKIEYDPSQLQSPTIVPIANIALAAFTGPDVSSTLEVNEIGHYTRQSAVEDHGTAIASQNSLTFTSAVTHKSMTVRARLSPPLSDEDLAVLGGEKGDSELTLSSTATNGFFFTGKPSRGVIGHWQMKNLMIAYRIWLMELTIGEDGTYSVKLSNRESGVLQAADGKWTTASGGISDSGNYRFDGKDRVTLVAGTGTTVFERVKQ